MDLSKRVANALISNHISAKIACEYGSTSAPAELIIPGVGECTILNAITVKISSSHIKPRDCGSTSRRETAVEGLVARGKQDQLTGRRRIYVVRARSVAFRY